MSSRLLDHQHVAIVGAGPSGLFCAYRLLVLNPGLQVTIFDAGSSVEDRLCAAFDEKDAGDSRVLGAGGAGLFSDGKLVLDLNAGGKVGSHLRPESERAVTKDIEETLVRHDGMSVTKIAMPSLHGLDLSGATLNYKPINVRHFSTEHLPQVVTGMISELKQRGVRFQFETRVIDVVRNRRGYSLLTQSNKAVAKFAYDQVVLAAGKPGSDWCAKIFCRENGNVRRNRRYLGVRIESPNVPSLAKVSGDLKLSQKFDDGSKAKTHCFCIGGQVLRLKYGRYIAAGGHSPTVDHVKRDLDFSNFGVLIGDTPREPYSGYDMRTLQAKVSTVANGGLIVQRYADWKRGRQTSMQSLCNNSVQPSCSHVSPGDVASLPFPKGVLQKVDSFLTKISELFPELIVPDTLIYAPAYEWWMNDISKDAPVASNEAGLFAVGDGAGVSQGIMQAAASGYVAAEQVLVHRNRLGQFS